MSRVQVERLRDAATFLQRAGPWLMREEARNNLMLSLADRLVQGTTVYEQGAYFAVVESGNDVVGCLMRTPPFKLLVSELPAHAVQAVIADVSSQYDTLPAVLGPELTAEAVATAWAAVHGLTARRGMQQRIYQLEKVTAPVQAPGAMRVALLRDLDLVTLWIESFSAEVRMPTQRARALAEERIVKRELFLWIDGEPRCMVAWAGRTPNGVRIAYVFTPVIHRNRGYASSCTALASQRVLDEGYRFCFLFTDLSNPTSNAIYQRLGYAPVADVADWHIA